MVCPFQLILQEDILQLPVVCLQVLLICCPITASVILSYTPKDYIKCPQTLIDRFSNFWSMGTKAYLVIRKMVITKIEVKTMRL